MTDKIESFTESLKCSDDNLSLPIEKESIINRLGSIPHDVAEDYADDVGMLIDDLIVLKNIIASSNRPHLVKHLVDGLTDYQLGRLSTIVLGLSGRECEHVISKIVNATLGIKTPTPESIQKAAELVEIIRKMKIDHEKKSKELAQVSRLIHNFCTLLLIFKLGNEAALDLYIKERLTMLPVNDLDWLIEIGAGKLASD